MLQDSCMAIWCIIYTNQLINVYLESHLLYSKFINNFLQWPHCCKAKDLFGINALCLMSSHTSSCPNYRGWNEIKHALIRPLWTTVNVNWRNCPTEVSNPIQRIRAVWQMNWNPSSFITPPGNDSDSVTKCRTLDVEGCESLFTAISSEQQNKHVHVFALIDYLYVRSVVQLSAN